MHSSLHYNQGYGVTPGKFNEKEENKNKAIAPFAYFPCHAHVEIAEIVLDLVSVFLFRNTVLALRFFILVLHMQ